jgi:hypothetical protein
MAETWERGPDDHNGEGVGLGIVEIRREIRERRRILLRQWGDGSDGAVRRRGGVRSQIRDDGGVG